MALSLPVPGSFPDPGTKIPQALRCSKKKKKKRTSLVVQWLRLHVPNAEGLGSISGQRTRSLVAQLKIVYATAKSPHSQINIFLKITGEHLLRLVIREL